MTIDKNALEVFVLVAQTRNFRIAAERLGVTRSAISQTLRRLEERMSVSLMLRFILPKLASSSMLRLHPLWNN